MPTFPRRVGHNQCATGIRIVALWKRLLGLEDPPADTGFNHRMKAYRCPSTMIQSVAIVSYRGLPLNVERLHAIVAALSHELESTQVAPMLDRLTAGLQNMVNQPQTPQPQQDVSSALSELRSTLPDVPSESFTPSWQQTLEEMGVNDLFGSALLQRIDRVIETNQMTPAVALEELQPYATRLREISQNLTQMLASFEYFDMGTEELAPGEVELSVLIPRDAVDNGLPDLGHEFVQLQALLGPFLEVSTGSRPSLKVRSIASSDFGVFLDLPLEAAAVVAASLAYLVARYKDLLEIRRLKQELADHDVPDRVLQGISDHADTYIKEAIAIEVARLTEGLDRNGRENELRMELGRSLTQIALRIDRGYNIDIRVEPNEHADSDGEDLGEDPDAAEAVLIIQSAAPNLKFIRSSGRPILSLGDGSTDDVGAGTEKDGSPEVGPAGEQ
jgi:hypothetical protein